MERGKYYRSAECRKKSAIARIGKHLSNETRKKLSDINRGKKLSDETRKKISESECGEKNPFYGKRHSEESRKKMSESQSGEKSRWYGKHLPEETRRKISDAKRGENHHLYGKHHSDQSIEKITEGGFGGFWYGKVRYYDRIYCELWCPDLWHRIDEAQNYQSILSGKTKEDNIGKSGKPRALSRHHVYWQPRACCVWDEDVGGYYAWIETGTKKYPNKVKYYINGDPNKFVLLTMSEHQMIKKDKIKWIEIFEELIDTKLGGVCYLPKGAV